MLRNPALRFFISSTTRDLGPIREALYHAITMAGHIPLGMEQWPASFLDSAEIMEKEINYCDIFVAILGGMYGTTMRDPDDEHGEKISHTHFEFRTASRLGKRILVFLMEEDAFNEYRKKLPPEDPDHDYKQQIINFREQARISGDHGRRFVCEFPFDLSGGNTDTSLVQITKHLLGSIHHLEDEMQTAGLVSAADSDPLISGNMRSNPILRKVINTFGRYELLSRRCTLNRDLKTGMARYFWDYCAGPIISSSQKNTILFESGTSLIYVAMNFMDRLLGEKLWRKFKTECEDSIRIITNNILIFLDFILTTDVHVDIWPKGKPEDKFGATFGEISSLWSPLPGGIPTNPEEETRIIEELREQLVSDDGINGVTRHKILLLGASGVYYELDNPKSGPHVGDYKNSIFKRVLLMSKYPAVFFVDSSKISLDIDYSQRYPVCNESFPWSKIISKVPIAFCVGARDLGKKKAILRHLGRNGFPYMAQERPERQYINCLPFLVCNEKFMNIFDIVWIDIENWFKKIEDKKGE